MDVNAQSLCIGGFIEVSGFLPVEIHSCWLSHRAAVVDHHINLLRNPKALRYQVRLWTALKLCYQFSICINELKSLNIFGTEHDLGGPGRDPDGPFV